MTDSEANGVNETRPTEPRSIHVNCKLRLECRDLSHPGAAAFFASCEPTKLSQAVQATLAQLYDTADFEDDIPSTRSVTLILRSMGGVAHTCGTELDNDHKEIHLSLDYVHGVYSRSSEGTAHEIRGVIVHEMVHAWQWNAQGSAPGGLIEGIADYVRLATGLAPSHWTREQGASWDQGYQHTAYFLQYLEAEYGIGSVRRINRALRHETYEADKFWRSLFNDTVNHLWERYQDAPPNLPERQMRHGDRHGNAQ